MMQDELSCHLQHQAGYLLQIAVFAFMRGGSVYNWMINLTANARLAP